MKTYQIKGWNKFQHFKDRRPPWIKLYRDILDDPEWHELRPEAAKALVMIWLIASEDSGSLPEARKIAFRLRLPENKTIQLLNELKHWLIQVNINLISSGYQDDTPERAGEETETERETESETEGETETEARARKCSKFSPAVIPDCLKAVEGFENAFAEYLKARKTKATTRAQELVLARLAQRPAGAVQALETAIVRGWTGFEWEWIDKAAVSAGTGKPGVETSRKNADGTPKTLDQMMDDIAKRSVGGLGCKERM